MGSGTGSVTTEQNSLVKACIKETNESQSREKKGSTDKGEKKSQCFEGEVRKWPSVRVMEA